MIGHEFALAIGAGVALALPYLLYAFRSRHRRQVFGAGLVVAAVVYVAFAVFGGRREALLIEAAGVVLFGVFAFLGVRRSAYFLALGWAAHVLWDLLLHPIEWYPVTCIGFDLVVAGAIFGASRCQVPDRSPRAI